MRRVSIFLWLGLALGILVGFKTLNVVLGVSSTMVIAFFFGKKRFILVVAMLSFLIGLAGVVYCTPPILNSPIEINATGYFGRYSALNDDKFVFCVSEILPDVDGKRDLLPDRFKCLITLEEQRPIVGGYYNVTLRISTPSIPSNPGMFNYRRFLLARDIKYCGEPISVELIENRIHFMTTWQEKLRQKIKTVLAVYFKSENVELASAMLLGDASQLDEETQLAFRKTGTSHVLAVSGLHFGIIFSGIALVLDRLQWPSRVRKFLILSMIGLFLFVVGFKSSALRAAFMIVLSMAILNTGRPYDRLNALALSGSALLLLRPAFLFDVGYQLSMTAVFGLTVIYPAIAYRGEMSAPLKSIVDSFLISLTVLFSTACLTAYHFNVLIWASIFYNIPVVFLTGIILPLLLLTVVFGAVPIFPVMTGRVTDYLMMVLNEMVNLSERISIGSIIMPSPGIIELSLSIAAMLLFLLRKMNPHFFCIGRLKLTGMALVLCVLSYTLPFDQWLRTYNEVRYFDVGQGDATLIITKDGEKILIDSGDGRSFREMEVLLLKSGISELDLMVLTHPHQDHIGGALSVLTQLNVARVIVSGATDLNNYATLTDTAAKNGTQFMVIYKGDKIVLKNGAIKFLNPERDAVYTSVNESSLAMTYETGNVLFLFTGDISSKQEYDIIDKIPETLTILKVAHHGSKTSTNPVFVDKLHPELSVISVGRNTFGHPGIETIETLKRINSVIARTDQLGCIYVRTDGQRLWWFNQLEMR